MEQAAQIFAAVQLFVMGLSHALQPRAWVDFFVWLRGKGHNGVFINGFLSLSFGAIIVAFHNVWSGLPVVLTLLGWMQIVKAVMIFVRPQWGMRSLERVSPERTSDFVIMGVVFIGLSGLFAYLALRG